MASYLNTAALTLELARRCTCMGFGKLINTIAKEVEDAEARECNVIMVAETSDGDFLHLANAYFDFHLVEEIWLSRKDIFFGANPRGVIGWTATHPSCAIMDDTLTKVEDGEVYWCVVKCTLKDPSTLPRRVVIFD